MPEQDDDIDPRSCAFFIDFDGTLARIVDRPETVRLEAAQAHSLCRLREASDGAVAIVSGRSIDQLDAYLDPLRLPLAGVHGLELRDPDGSWRRMPFDGAAMEAIGDEIRRFADRHDGLIAEAKPGAMALHYRQRPDLATEAVAFARALHARHSDASLLLGKMVAELRLGGRSKADAVDHFMALAPFRGRIPVFFGDDVTDEDGFRRAAELGGTGVRIGRGDTAARMSFDGIEDFWNWFATLANAGGGEMAQGAGATDADRQSERSKRR